VIILSLIAFVIFTHWLFDKSYKNTELAHFINTCFKFSFWLLPFIWFVFYKDISHPQWSISSGSSALGLVLFIFISPIFVVLGFLGGHTLFVALLMFIHALMIKLSGQRSEFLSSIMLTTLFMTLFLELLWWTVFYTKVSLPIRVYTWTLLILIAPWLPIMAALLLQKYKRDRKPPVY